MVTKIKGRRLKPKAVAEFNEKMAYNINILETKLNQIIDILQKNKIK